MIITSKVFPHRSCDVVVQGFSDGIVKFLTGDIGTVWPRVRFAFDEYFAGNSAMILLLCNMRSRQLHVIVFYHA